MMPSHRARPILMAFVAMRWAGVGADIMSLGDIAIAIGAMIDAASVMKRIAAPMVGGMVSSTILTLVVIPAVYSLWKERALRRAPVLARQLTPALTEVMARRFS